MKRKIEDKIKPVCFGSSDIDNTEFLVNGLSHYNGKCLICKFEDECAVAYLIYISSLFEPHPRVFRGMEERDET